MKAFIKISLDAENTWNLTGVLEESIVPTFSSYKHQGYSKARYRIPVQTQKAPKY